MTFIGLDIGSSSIKAGLLAGDGERTAVSQVIAAPFPERIADRPEGWFEVDPNAVVAQCRELIERLVGQAERCEGILTSCQMGGVVVADDRGASATNYLSWRDQRTLSDCGDGESYLSLIERHSTEDDLRAIGRELKPGGAAALLFWLVRSGTLPTGATTAMGLGDFVLSQLCQASPLTHASAALGMVDLSTGDWRREWFKHLGFGRLAWQVLAPTNRALGSARINGRSIPCYPAVGDHQAALFGASLAPSELSINVSTGSQVSLVSRSFEPGDYQTRPFFDDLFLNTITHLPAGRSLGALVELLSELAASENVALRDPWAAIGRAVDRTPATDLEVDLAFFASAVGDRGKISGARIENLTVGHLFRAAFKNMADNYAACARRLSPRGDFQRIVLSGGLCQKLPALRAEILSRFTCDHRMVEETEETLLGLARLAAKAPRS